MGRKLLYIINPISGTKNKHSLRTLIETKTQAAGINFEIAPSVANSDYSFLTQTLETGITDIIIAGGDGTINGAVNDLRRWELPFGIIPCGSGNGLALSAGIPKDASKALDRIFRGEHSRTDAFTINGQFACMLCGLGFDAQVAHDFANDPKRGLTTYIRKTVRHFFQSATYGFELTAAGKTFSTDAFFISIANSNQFGNNFTIAPQASLNDGLLDVVIMTRQHKLSVLLQAFMQVGGYNKLQDVKALREEASVLYFQTPSIVIENMNNAPLHIDGDPMQSVPTLDIRIIPGCFSLIS